MFSIAVKFCKPLPLDDLTALAASPVWNNVRPRRILFTGASGFFGSWLLESFLFASQERGFSARALVLTRNARRFAEKFPQLSNQENLEIIEGDARSFHVSAGPLDAIIHSLVPDSGTPLDEMDAFFSDATTNLLALACERDCQNFLLCSTGAVYQAQNLSQPYAESDPLVSLDGSLSYGQIRRKVEEQCLHAFSHHHVPLKIARGFAFVGPRLPLDGNFAVGNFLRDGLAEKPISIKGDGTTVRSYLYAADMTLWLWNILWKGRHGEAYNVGDSESVSIEGLATMIGNLLQAQVTVHGIPTPGAAPPYYVPNVGKIFAHFNLPKQTPLLTSLEKAIDWLRPSSVGGIS